MKRKKFNRIIVGALISTIISSSFVTGATTRTVSFNTSYLNRYEEIGNVLKVDMDENGQVTYSTTSNLDKSTDSQEERKFSWDNATVYFVLTDRFSNGDTSNDYSYGRGLDQNGNVQEGYENNPGGFHGGDLKGLTQKLEEGYFTDLGVNAIWLTAPYEQIHGFTSGNAAGGNGQDNGEGFPYYSYHGYWTLDYTNIDENMGTEEDFRNFVDTAHEQGIRVVMDIVLNHVGYTTMKDADEYGFGSMKDGWEDYYYGDLSDLDGGSVESNTWYNKDDPTWATNWWGNDFVRVSAGYAGYESYSDGGGYTNPLSGLPDIKTEITQEVELPAILETKWKREGRYEEEMAELDEFFTNRNLPRTPRNYVIKWLTDYIRDYGIDGFRCDTANHVEMEGWAALNEEADIAFEEYKANNPDKVLDAETDFWTTGESWGHGVTKSAFFTSGGFSSIINFSFKGASTSNLKSKYNELAKVNKDDEFNVLSYISSHDDTLYDRNNLIDGGTSLLLAPGAVQIFYGDETARPLGWTDFFTKGEYKDQMYRTSMNWSDLTNSNSQASKTLAHWQKLGQFRNNHLAVGAGENIDIADSPYTFGRIYNKDGDSDRVVCVVGASGTVDVDVSKVFSNGSKVRDAYTGAITTVKDGKATFTADSNGVILIEKGDKSPDVSISEQSKKYWTDTLELKLYVSNSEVGRYSINGVEQGTYTNGQTITIGEGVDFDETTEVTVYAKNLDGESEATYTYTKVDASKIKVKVNYDNPNNWANPYVYIYRDVDGVVEEVAPWPGVKLEKDSDGWYSYTQPLWESAKVIFSNAGGSQNPGQGQDGYNVTDEMWYYKGTWYTTNPLGPTINSLSTDKKSPQGINEIIEVSAYATGSGTLQYKFEVEKDGNSTVIKDYSTNNTTTWIPTEIGNYKIKVTVKDSNGMTSQKTVSFVIEKGKLIINDVNTNKAEGKVGEALEITTNASGLGELQYKVSTHEIKEGWKNLTSKYSTENVTQWTPDKAGTYKIWVDVKDEDGNKESKYITIKVTK
ncbi:alpha-amylase family glycosyl hydrolase [Clostridium sp. D43t1_170807_H7]|uniref:alpha-amylase family glycosyl hydrolase n=1 Tax=Clostridium sp. D43t1_170807_H7 TaxID=2787140 RepID=UPI001FABDC69|nr:alpha-amylase family glycosyl hydrolase [Clostridium sp. D43t1_170807_H7]